MTAIKTTIHLFLLAAALAISSTAFATTPLMLDLKENGDIVLETDNLPPLVFYMQVSDNTTETSAKGVLKSQITEPGGKTFNLVRDYAMLSGATAQIKINARINDGNCTVNAGWSGCPTRGDGGKSGFKLKMPPFLLKDITVEREGTVVFTDYSASHSFKTKGNLVFKRTSTGAFLFKIAAEEIVCNFQPDNPESNMIVEFWPTTRDGQEVGCTLSFK